MLIQVNPFVLVILNVMYSMELDPVATSMKSFADVFFFLILLT
jgi:hypothetical protein